MKVNKIFLFILFSIILCGCISSDKNFSEKTYNIINKTDDKANTANISDISKNQSFLLKIFL
ncbi:hypothetical protein Mefer_0012 [Methanocaldococcus fervens AG86]|uniref:Lipoprotein n=1 Tax=Methanocaldococcus fervens (strain DSM 4213 / JCM 15782 / AG86) TaxID=573064 RepID=C7P5M2_METFA|nr:hypothetical protein Mefer_0012 [Methanocaldococcus fervens AG86]